MTGRALLSKCTLLILLLTLAAAPAMAQLTLQSYDMDNASSGQQWRRLGFILTNEGTEDIEMTDVTLEYVMAGGNADEGNFQIFMYRVRSANWSTSNRNDNAMEISFVENADGTSSMIITFTEFTLPADGGVADIEFGMYYDGYPTIDETQDPSYIPSNNPVDNPGVIINGGDGPTGMFSITAGLYHSCAIRAVDGEALCWGYDHVGQSSPPEGVAFTQIASGYLHNCGIRESDAQMQCWGSNWSGQCDPPAGVAFTEVFAGTSHTCGIREDTNEVECWGFIYDDYGMAPPPAGTVTTSFSTGKQHHCGVLASNGETVCWGGNNLGQATPPAGVAFSEVSAGGLFSCGIRVSDGEAQCWGREGPNDVPPPVGVALMDISSSWHHSCAIRVSDGQVECWGEDWNTSGQIYPPAGVEFVEVVAGIDHSCGIRASDLQAVCWGSDEYGRATPPVVP